MFADFRGARFDPSRFKVKYEIKLDIRIILAKLKILEILQNLHAENDNVKDEQSFQCFPRIHSQPTIE